MSGTTGTRQTGKLWAIGGAVVAVVVVVVSWSVFISPRTAEAADMQDQATAAEDRLTALQHKLVTLREDAADVNKFRAQLETNRLALPTTSAVPDLLRDLQSAATQTGVSVDGMSVGGAAATEVPSVSSLSITLTVVGAQPKLNAFLDKVQGQLPRAVLIDSANSTPSGPSGLNGGASLSLTMKVFVATAEAPAPAASPTAPAASSTPAPMTTG
jgi:Tfp pilus assembly protein PilO